MSAITLDDVIRFGSTPEMRLNARVMAMTFGISIDYKDFWLLLEELLDSTVSDLASRRNNLQSSSEDALTDQVVSSLRRTGLTASRETQASGHCDVTVQTPSGFLYLGEAKIFSSYVKLVDGYKQLLDRYSSGLPEQSQGFMLIYFFVADVRARMEKWCVRLRQERAGVSARLEPQSLVMHSAEPHQSTGLSYQVRHFAYPLLHNPTD